MGHKFKSKSGKETPKIGTSSLPDIIFILLFFFMVVTVMRDASLKVSYQIPKATELQKLEKKSLVNYMHIGTPVDKETFGTAPRLQLDDAFATPDEIGTFVNVCKSKASENEKNALIYSIKADKKVTMGIITDVKQELRKADALKLNYSATERGEVY